MSRYVSETKAAGSISAWIITDKRGEFVAKVQAHYGSGGRVLVNVFQASACAARCAKVRGLLSDKAREQFGFQYGSASGGGYDKEAAALAGLIIDGHSIADHCGGVPEDEKKRARLLAAYNRNPNARTAKEWDAAAERIGARWANWRDGHYASLYFRPGLDRLQSFGYHVHSAI